MAYNIKQERHMGPGAGGPGGINREKVAEGTWKKLLKYCRKYWLVIILAVLFSVAGSALTLAGPGRLSEITDTITEGITPDQEKLEQVIEQVADNMSANTETLMNRISDTISGNMEVLTVAVSQNIASVNMEQKAVEILQSPDISDEDKAAFRQVMAAVTANPETAQAQLAGLPATVQEVLLDSVTVNGTEISAAEQFEMLEVFGSTDPLDSQAGLEAADQLPETVKSALYTDITVNGSVITGAEQQKAIEVLSGIDTENQDPSAQTDLMETLPDSVQSALYTDLAVDGVTVSGRDQRDMIRLMSGLDENDTDAALEAVDALPDSVYALVEPSIDIEKIMGIALLLVGFYAAGAILSVLQGWIMATVTQRISKALRKDISGKINRLPMGYYHHNSTGDVLSRVTNDVDTIGTSLNMSVGTLVSAVTLFAGSFVMMLATNAALTVTGVLATAIGFVLMMVIMGRSQKYFSRQQKHLGALNGYVEEMYSGHTVVKAYNGEEKANREFSGLNEKLRVSGFKAQALSGLMMPIMTFIGNFGYVAVCVIGAALALNGHISFGVIVSFMMYIRYFTQPLSQIAQATQAMQSAGAACARVFEFLEAEEMKDESDKSRQMQKAEGNVSFSHVKFGYEPDRTIIHDFSAEIKAGQKVAIVGPTGAGKTTLVNLLMRFYEIDGGEIRIDGIPTSRMKREEVHAQFCMVLQDTWLFEGTVRENLIYCSENKSEEKMRNACKAVGLDHFIQTLPDGYDTVLDDQVNLSQGQKQQLTIARAMIADKPILILDEATSSIDTRTEKKIQQAMDELMKGRTSFVIAHRLSTIRNSDLILVLKDGDVLESGTHDELMEQNGFYAELYNSQFEQAS